MDRPASGSADAAVRPYRCLSCGGSTRTVFPKDGFAIRECADCAFAFAVPRPSADDVAALYHENDPAVRAPAQYDLYARHVGDAEEPRRVYRRLRSLGLHRGRALDVGAGFGKFSAYLAARGFDVLPLESDPLCARRIRKRLGVPVVHTTFEAWQPRREDANAYDLIVMSQVLEHSLEPGAWLVKARALLRPRGLLFVGVPNFASLTTAVLGRREGLICPPVHLNFLCRRSLAHMGAEAGFAIEDSFTWSWVTPALAVALVGRRLGIPAALAAVPAWGIAAALRAADAIGRGRYLYAFLRPTRPRSKG